MANFALSNRGIICIETPWEPSGDGGDETQPKSLMPGLQLITRYHAFTNLLYRTCSTRSELEWHLKDFKTVSKSSRAWYGMLYFAMHGSAGRLQLAGEDHALGLAELADLMKGSFKGFTIYFGSCAVMSCAESQLEDFLNQTKADCLVGYKSDVDWVDSTIIDMLFMNRFIDDDRGKSKKVFWRNFRRDYGPFVRKYNMKFYGE